MDGREKRALVVKIFINAFYVRQEKQLLRRKCPCDLRRNVVGVDVVTLAIRPYTDGRNNRHIVVVQQILDHRNVDIFHCAHVANVHLMRCIVLVYGRHLLARADQPCILAREADGTNTALVQEIDNLRVDLAVEYHLGNLNGLLICHAEPGDERGLLADLFQKPRDLRSTAMNDDGTDADILHQCHVAHDVFLQHIAHHRVAAVLYDDRRARELLDVREGINQDLRLVLIAVHSPHLRYDTRH